METLKLDLIDQLAGLSAGDSVHKLRHWRDKVALATEGSYAGIFGANRNGNGNDNGHMYLAGLTLAERLLVAFYICVLTPSPALAKHYLRRITSLNEKPLPAALDALRADNLTAIEGTRLKAILGFARTLTLTPISGDKALLHSLPAAGLDTPSVVALAQLIAFLSYQIRLLAGVQAMAWLQASNEPARDERAQDQGTNDNQAQGHNTSIKQSSHRIEPTHQTRKSVNTPLGSTYTIQGFTNASLEWKAWLNTVDVANASADQLEVLKESHPKAMTSDYYLFLVHQPKILQQRSIAFNAIMYAPGGMSRAERELGATVVSRINGCVYCAAVHAQRYEQMAKRNAVILQVFENPYGAGDTPREQAIVDFSIALTIRPQALHASDVQALLDVGLKSEEVLDLIHSVAIFAWANRLMLNLGEPVFEEKECQ